MHFLLDDLRIASPARLPARVLALPPVELDVAAAPVQWRAREAIALIPWNNILVVLGPVVLLLPRGAVALLLFLWR